MTLRLVCLPMPLCSGSPRKQCSRGCLGEPPQFLFALHMVLLLQQLREEKLVIQAEGNKKNKNEKTNYF
jgi:hypothetical protein